MAQSVLIVDDGDDDGWCCVFPQCGSVRVDSLDDFAYGSEILVNTTDKVMDVRAAGLSGAAVMMGA